MKSFKRLVVFMLVLSMVIGTMVPAFAFSDVEDTYYEDEINKLAAVGVVTGDPEGTFRPEDNITRAEVAVIICKMLGAGNTMDAQKNMPSAFSDVAAGEWYTGAVNLATGNGVIAGFPDGTFRPNDNITVAQAVTLMVKALGRGVYVDEAGQWPANYIAEAAKLGVTANVVAGAQDDLANRGMVSAMAWNSLDIAVWDVTSTNNKGEIISTVDDTMLEKYFKDFVTNDKDDYGNLKWAEDIDVTATYLTDKAIAKDQIVVSYDAVKKAIKGFKADDIDRVKDEDTMTYVDGNTDKLVVYVADENVSVAELLNKKVDIMFGKDNVATLVVVREDAELDMLTKYLADDDSIVIGSTEYELDDEVEITINNVVVYADDPDTKDSEAATTEQAKTAIETVIKAVMGVEDVNNKSIPKAIKASVSLTGSNKVEKLALEISGNITLNINDVDVVVKQVVVKEIDDEVLEVVSGSDINIEELADEEDVITVLRDGEEAELTDIAVGDVITYTGDIKSAAVMYVSSAKVTGNVDKVKTHLTMVVDGTAYYANKDVVGNLSMDLEDATTSYYSEANMNKVVKEDVELSLNYLGEVVVVLADTEGGDWNFGIVKDARTNDDVEEEYTRIRVKVLTAAGESKVYYVFEEDKDIDEDDAVKAVSGTETLTEGDFIAYRVTGENEIDAEDDIMVINAAVNTEGKLTVGDEDYFVIKGVDADDSNYDDELIAGKEFDADTVIFNRGMGTEENDADKIEVITAGFDALVSDADDTNVIGAADPAEKAGYVVYSEEDDTIKFIAVTGEYGFVSTDDDYAFVVNMDMIEDDAYEVTLYVEGETKTYETNGINAAFTEGDFIKYEITGAGKIDVAANKSMRIINVEEINVLDEDVVLVGYYDANVVKGLTDNAYVTKEHINVESVNKSAVKFDDEIAHPVANIKFQKDDDKFDGIIYDLSDIDAPAMVSDIADIDNKVVFAIDSDNDDLNKADIFVIVKK